MGRNVVIGPRGPELQTDIEAFVSTIFYEYTKFELAVEAVLDPGGPLIVNSILIALT